MVQPTGPADLLVGREAERDALTSAIDAAVSGRPAVAWVEGEAGMGKTTLVRHVVAQLPSGVQVQQVAADELASQVPFDLAHRLGSRSPEAFAAGMEILESWSDRQDEGPLVVVVEDLHWADGPSAGALLTAVQRLDEDRVAVIVTARPGAQGSWDRFRRDAERCRTIEVGSFDEKEVATVASSAGIELTPYQAERLRAHTGGHPLYVRTLLTELGTDELRAPDGDLPAPRSLTSSVTARLSEMPEAARSLAAALAVLNHRAVLPLVGRVAGVDAPIEPFEQLLQTGFVSWDPQEPGPRSGSPIRCTDRRSIRTSRRACAVTSTWPRPASPARRRAWRTAWPRPTARTTSWPGSSRCEPEMPATKGTRPSPLERSSGPPR